MCVIVRYWPHDLWCRTLCTICSPGLQQVPPTPHHADDHLTNKFSFKIKICNSISDHLITTKFCTWHGSIAAMSSTTFCSDHFFVSHIIWNNVTIKSEIMFENYSVTWAPFHTITHNSQSYHTRSGQYWLSKHIYMWVFAWLKTLYYICIIYLFLNTETRNKSFWYQTMEFITIQRKIHVAFQTHLL